MSAEMIRHYLDLGWVVLPIAEAGGKAPRGKNWPDQPPETDLNQYKHGAYLVCGKRSGVSVIDLDSEEWFEIFAPLVMGNTPYASTPSGGAHIFVRYSDADWWGNNVRIAPDLDLRNDRGGVVLPTGGSDRRWGDAPWSLPPADPEPFEELLLQLMDVAPGPTPGDSQLSNLLAQPPREGQRNDWLTKVAGHLVPIIPWEDGYLQLINTINKSLDEPLPAQEVGATVGTLWSRHHGATGGPVDHDLPTAHEDGKIYLWHGVGKRAEKRLWMEPEPDLRRRMRDGSGSLLWEIESEGHSVVLRPQDVHNSQRLSSALGGIDVLVYPRAAGNQPHGAMFQKWLQAQPVETVDYVEHWGWSDHLGQWVGLEGTAQGPEQYRPLIGEVDRPDIIEKIPTWQEDEIAAVFCAWVALQAVKGRVPVGLEPNMVLQGAAGSGKTRGIFAFGARLTGSVRKSSGTIATIRDRLAGHRNGIVVIDDHTTLEQGSPRLLELYRVSASSEAITLKRSTGHGWEDQAVRLVGSVLASGESLVGLSNDRALRDRSVVLEVPPTADRMSLYDPKVPQWEDLLATFAALGGSDESTAHEVAGPFIRRMLAAADEIVPPANIGNRVKTKLELLMYGAELWQTAYPNSYTYEGYLLTDVVNDWALRQSSEATWQDTTLIQRILPHAADPMSGAAHAVKIDEDGRLCIHPQRLSRWWSQTHSDARNRELASVGNIRREIQFLADSGEADTGQQRRMAGKSSKVAILSHTATSLVMEMAGIQLEQEQLGMGS